MTRWVLSLLLLAAGTAHADVSDDLAQVERCGDGAELAKKGDLPRAALYLEDCEDDESVRLAALVAKKLRASNLSALSISTTPGRMVGRTDALPGELFTTPATIWARAGTYTITVAHDYKELDEGRGISTTTKLAARSRGSVILEGGTKTKAPKDGKVDFTEDVPEQTAHEGPPPAVKHGSMLPGKYRGELGPKGPELDDPFTVHRHDHGIHWLLGARISAGVFDHVNDAARAGFGVALKAARPLGGPALLAARLDYTHRSLDAIGLDAGASFLLGQTRSLALLAGAALRGEVRVQDTLEMQPVSRVGLGGAVELDLALARVPLAFGLRFEQGFTELVPGARDRGVLVEVGYDWR